MMRSAIPWIIAIPMMVSPAQLHAKEKDGIGTSPSPASYPGTLGRRATPSRDSLLLSRVETIGFEG
ncbi:hypothetical protein FHR21_004136 [Sphingopyxis panaciterrulae]|uniref:Uncharacterized protein n=1 Tax=Sphingopyxis panaciterrulae TaxID=462372 RepID=A0A7W9B9W0_9SPHN|nr:hypothetical protein [Sphingopyxis panaciterrulae]